MPSYVVTGASRGLGYELVKQLSADPSNLVIGVVRNVPATTDRLAKDQIKNVHLLSADVTDPTALGAAASATAALTGGALDILIHNAAYISTVSSATTVLDHTPQELEDELVTSFRANTVGTAHTINAFLPLIRKGGLKKVISISTGYADPPAVSAFGLAAAVPYSVSKAAANLLIAKYHATLGNQEGILFLSLSPGLVDTSEGKNPAAERDHEWFRQNFAKFADYSPGFKGPITPEESVKAQLKVIREATVETLGGDFVSHHGNKTWL